MEGSDGTLARRLSLRDRPQTAPMGPRRRYTPSRVSTILPQDATQSPVSRSPRISITTASNTSSEASPRYTEQSDSKSTPATTLSPVSQQSATAAAYVPSPPSDESRHSSPAPSLLSATSRTPEISQQEPLSIKTVPKVPALAVAPQIKFDSTPVQWKGLPLEAALWTFNSRELQELVSRAIRASSQESFIRVMSVDVLDRQLPFELRRLEELKANTQSKYRFMVQRRTMLMQALHSFSGSNDDDPALLGKLTNQLSQTTAECDKLLEDLLQISDQAAQIQRLQDIHFSSALAIALRKLNTSYGRRTSELLSARNEIADLEAQLNDAWQQAEKLAREMNELDAEADAASDVEEEDTAVIEIAEVVSLNHRKSPSASSILSVRPFQDTLSLDAVSRMHSEQSKQDPEPAHIKLPSPTPSETELFGLNSIIFSDVASIHSNHSARSAKSSRTQRSQRNMDRVSVVAAARRRSLRTSMSNLRMPSIKMNAKGSPHPPVPALPTVTSPVTPSRQPPLPRPTVESFLDFGGKEDTDESSDTENDVEDVDPVPRRTSIEEIEVVAPRAQAPIVTRDDIHVMPSRSATETELVAPRRSQFSLDHQHPFANEEPVNTSIPSIWLLQDTPKTPAERVESLMQDRGPGHTKLNSFQRLKSLTKRYSLPFPTTVPRSRPSRNATAGS